MDKALARRAVDAIHGALKAIDEQQRAANGQFGSGGGGGGGKEGGGSTKPSSKPKKVEASHMPASNLSGSLKSLNEELNKYGAFVSQGGTVMTKNGNAGSMKVERGEGGNWKLTGNNGVERANQGSSNISEVVKQAFPFSKPNGNVEYTKNYVSK
jgi:hypothetical protein